MAVVGFLFEDESEAAVVFGGGLLVPGFGVILEEGFPGSGDVGDH